LSFNKKLQLLKYLPDFLINFGFRWLLFRYLYGFKASMGLLEKRIPQERWGRFNLKDFYVDSSLARLLAMQLSALPTL